MKGKDLSYELVETQPEYFDFSEGYPEKWDIPFDLTEEEQENEEYVPMMNYIYPLGDAFQVPQDCRKKLVNTTIVQIDGKFYLALTGGGMDLSWEICESFINLGYYPPTHFSRLPSMSGRGESAKDRRIIQCCNESLRTVAQWNTDRLRENEERFPKSKEAGVSK